LSNKRYKHKSQKSIVYVHYSCNLKKNRQIYQHTSFSILPRNMAKLMLRHWLVMRPKKWRITTYKDMKNQSHKGIVFA